MEKVTIYYANSNTGLCYFALAEENQPNHFKDLSKANYRHLCFSEDADKFKDLCNNLSKQLNLSILNLKSKNLILRFLAEKALKQEKVDIIFMDNSP